MNAVTIRQPWPALISVGAINLLAMPYALDFRGPAVVAADSRHVPLDENGFLRISEEWSVRDTWAGCSELVGPDGTEPIRYNRDICKINVVDCIPIVSTGSTEFNEVDGAYYCVDSHLHRTERGSTFGGLRLIRTEKTDAGWASHVDSGGPGLGYESQRVFSDFEPGKYAWVLDLK